MLKLNGKTALVTGATKRIGRQIVLALADAGVNVVVHYRELAGDAEKLCEELRTRGVKAWHIEADLENLEDSRQLFSRVAALAGPVELLVNNASQFLPSTVQDMDFAGLMRHMQVNVWAPFVISREFARHAGHGKIVNLLDSRITGFDRSHVAYILSKRLFAVLTEMMAREFAPGITVNGIAPGLILPPPGKDPGWLDELAKTVPLKCHGDPGDIADAALYLLKSDFVTGQIIFVDGGRHLMEQDHGPHHNY